MTAMLAEMPRLANRLLSAIKKSVRKKAERWNGARMAFVLITIAAWFALSNHCALGALQRSTESTPEMSGCPMHSTPAKKKPAAKIPCCKDIRATVAKSVAANPISLRSIGCRDYAPEIFLKRARVAIEIEVLETGPPRCFSFAESVLQESMLSHAPPVS
jgi:hypothetical protein